mmetsp:Transcript_734/g.1979  ORF Transcript_734/g.1979 Transcript_734/m.1979 type:complete len:201 (-) Transcript_734:28-630(-)
MLSHCQLECFIDADCGHGRRFAVLTADAVRLMLGFLTRHSASIAREVTLVSHDDHRELLTRIHILYTGDAGHEIIEFIVRGARPHIEDQEKGIATSHPAIAHHSVLLLTSCVEDEHHARLVVNHSALAVSVFDGRVVAIGKVTHGVAYGQARLASTSSSQHCQPRLRHLLLMHTDESAPDSVRERALAQLSLPCACFPSL